MFLRDALGVRAEGSRVSSNPAGETGFFISFLPPLSNKPYILYVAKPVVTGGFR
jgi:hypothetical protein